MNDIYNIGDRIKYVQYFIGDSIEEYFTGEILEMRHTMDTKTIAKYYLVSIDGTQGGLTMIQEYQILEPTPLEIVIFSLTK